MISNLYLNLKYDNNKIFFLFFSNINSETVPNMLEEFCCLPGQI